MPMLNVAYMIKDNSFHAYPLRSMMIKDSSFWDEVYVQSKHDSVC